MAIDQSALEELTARFTGRLVLPGDAGYDEARQIHNGAIDKRPALIARCVGTADVQDAVRFAREHELRIAIRGGGHNVAGRAVCDDGLMIDLSLMSGILVDAPGQTARAQGGVTWGAFNRETQVHSLATTGGLVSTTGVAGLTLGGGLGWLMGRFGLAADNLRSAEVVTATGEVVRAGAGENEDLLWALRGGGGNFGVVTSLEYDLHPVGPMVTGGLIAFPFDQARQVLRNYREFTASLPDDLTAFCGLIHAPDGSGGKLAAVIVCHAGSLDEGEAAVAPVKGFRTRCRTRSSTLGTRRGPAIIGSRVSWTRLVTARSTRWLRRSKRSRPPCRPSSSSISTVRLCALTLQRPRIHIGPRVTTSC